MKRLGDSIPSYTRLELERSASSLLSSRPGVSDSAPVAIGVLLEKMPDYAFTIPCPLLADRIGTEGMVLTPTFMHRVLVVVIDHAIMAQRDPAPYNMTLAEEIGHMHLHRSVMLDIESIEEFMMLQEHPRWEFAESDARFWGRAILMPAHLLEPVADRIYRRLTASLGFVDLFHFSAVFTSHLATTFEVPLHDAQKRLDSYPGDLRGRLEKSFAARSDTLLSPSDDVVVCSRFQQELTNLQLFGDEPPKGLRHVE